tara:strand:+ start:14027 stop:14584 length:558 start_codon:yes stop_codon:yes gene_type:complete
MLVKNPYRISSNVLEWQQIRWDQMAIGLIALSVSAYAEVKLPFGLVPFTFQTLVIMLIGLKLNPREALITVASYIFLGAIGAPIWSGGSFGLAHLAGPTGGFLFGFFFAALTISFLVKTLDWNHWGLKLLALVLGQAFLFAMGVSWLSLFVGWETAIASGLLPFLPSAFIKTAIALALVPTLHTK